VCLRLVTVMSSDSIRNSVYFSLLARPGSCLRVVSGVSSQSRCAPSGVMVSPRRSHSGLVMAVPLVVCVLDICPEGVGAAVVDLSGAVAVRRPDLAVGTVGSGEGVGVEVLAGAGVSDDRYAAGLARNPRHERGPGVGSSRVLGVPGQARGVVWQSRDRGGGVGARADMNRPILAGNGPPTDRCSGATARGCRRGVRS